ncbi:hemolysin D [Rhodoblastus acidophilus]|uniref:HlyD family type I secretion periplasmic adaptor subunit n=1 Tax=Rhodoblastus acidophilus TaxID=1074 RepID=UPI00222493C9|nr:HlyD family type I secretion periplasmic adaptor subunit [Rhodoblastus acidophilus]MCW2286672.1 hemolysin D [Rhodoblastus acidophilus]MCW2335492.1 hemolysin D [Rhodoblastus acidophilus]
MSFLWTICALVLVALALAYFGRIDIVASAQGKIEPTGRVKVVQPVETGRITAIHVVNDSLVQEGDVLVELDRSAAEAEAKAARNELSSARAEAVRRRAAFYTAQAHKFAGPPAPEWPADLSQGLREREERVFLADFSQLNAVLGSLEAQSRQKMTERDMLQLTIETQKSLIATLQQRVDMRSALVKSGSGPISALIDATETLNTQKTQLSLHQTQLAAAVSGVDVTERDYEKQVQVFMSEQAQKLDEAERKIEDVGQRLVKAEAKLDNLSLRAPIAGRVQSSIITNVGQVLVSGQEVMRVVPLDQKLEIVAYVLNRDIGFISVGQEAVVKIESFPFTRYGSIVAHVKRIARDAIPAPDASGIEGDPAHPMKAQGYAGAERTQNLVFGVELELEASSILIDGVSQPLTSGMAVAVEFKTGARRLMEYLFSPLMETGSRAMRER